MSIIDDIKYGYLKGSMLMRLIFINIGVCVLLALLAFGGRLFGTHFSDLLSWVVMPSDFWLLLKRPWTMLTYMFVHTGLLHILFNMLWLYWLGRIFMEYFSPKQLVALYILGGIGGAVLFLLAFNLLPGLAAEHQDLIGASASVIAIVVAVAVYAPDYKIGLLFLGEISLKWIAIVTVLIALLGLDAQNVGASLAHIGGAIVGAWFAWRIKQGHDITRPLNALIDALAGLFAGVKHKFSNLSLPDFKRRPSTGKTQRGGAEPKTRAARNDDAVNEEELDKILKKIKVAGYDALTDAERDALFNVSRRRSPRTD